MLTFQWHQIVELDASQAARAPAEAPQPKPAPRRQVPKNLSLANQPMAQATALLQLMAHAGLQMATRYAETGHKGAVAVDTA